MKRVICLLFLCIILLPGCNRRKVSESVIIEDLTQIDFSEHLVDSPYIYQSDYSYSPKKVIRRQTNYDSNEDIVFYEVIANNKYFKTTFSIKLVYNYYDEGGWFLEHYEIDSVSTIPLTCPEADLILEGLKSEYGSLRYYDNEDSSNLQINALMHLSQADHIEINPTGLVDNIATFNLTLSVSDIATIDGSINAYFDEELGWSFTSEENDVLFCIDSKHFNYENALGTFKCVKHYAWLDKPYTDEFQIYSVEPDKKIVMADRGSQVFDPLSINGLVTPTDNDIHLYYVSIDDTWNWGDLKYTRQP